MTAPRRKPRAVKNVELDAAAAPADEAGPGNPAETPPEPDLEVIFPDPGQLTIVGIPVELRRLQTREVLLAVRVVTAGMGAGIMKVDLTLSKEELLPVLFGLLVNALPEAPDEFIDLLAAVVTAKNKEQRGPLAEVMLNPPPGATLDIIAGIYAQEKDDLADLLGKAAQLFGFQQALYRTGKQGK